MKTENIVKICEAKEISIEELAKKILVDEESLKRYLKEGDMKVSILEKIQKVLEVPFGYFLNNVSIEVDRKFKVK